MPYMDSRRDIVANFRSSFQHKALIPITKLSKNVGNFSRKVAHLFATWKQEDQLETEEVRTTKAFL